LRPFFTKVRFLLFVEFSDVLSSNTPPSVRLSTFSTPPPAPHFFFPMVKFFPLAFGTFPKETDHICESFYSALRPVATSISGRSGFSIFNDGDAKYNLTSPLDSFFIFRGSPEESIFVGDPRTFLYTSSQFYTLVTLFCAPSTLGRGILRSFPFLIPFTSPFSLPPFRTFTETTLDFFRLRCSIGSGRHLSPCSEVLAFTIQSPPLPFYSVVTPVMHRIFLPLRDYSLLVPPPFPSPAPTSVVCLSLPTSHRITLEQAVATCRCTLSR